MSPETEAFLHDLFAHCSSESSSVFLTLTAIHPDGAKPTPSRHVLLGDADALEDAVSRLCKANEQGWGAFIGMAPRQRDFGRWMRGGKTDLVCLPALFVDLDEPDHALIDLGWFDLPASCIVHSGQGYHAYWFLEEPTVDFVQADLILRGLAQRLHGDEALSVAQSMRLPGTINTKPRREGAVCSFISYHPERRYQVSAFKPFLPKAPREPRSRHTYTGYRHELSRAVIEDLTDAVLHQLAGHSRGNGFIAACCPFPHEKDRPGMHFSYHPESGWGYCFGKHGKVSPRALCKRLGVLVHDERGYIWPGMPASAARHREIIFM
jgi:hypothetical protein